VGLGVKPVGEPDAGKPHVRFDERGREKGRWDGLRHRWLSKETGNGYSPCFPLPRPSSTLLEFRGPSGPAGAAIASPGRSQKAIFGAAGL